MGSTHLDNVEFVLAHGYAEKCVMSVSRFSNVRSHSSYMPLSQVPLDPSLLEGIIDRQPLTVSAEMLLIDVLALMSQVSSAAISSDPTNPSQAYSRGRSSCALIVDHTKLIGIFTERDLVKLAAQQRSLEGVRVGEVMTTQVISLTTDKLQDVFIVLSTLRQNHIRHLPLLDSHTGDLAGLITLSTLRQTLQPNMLLRYRRVAEVMSANVVHAPPQTSLLALSQLMTQRGVSCVVISEPGTKECAVGDQTCSYPLGIVTERDIVQFKALGFDFSELQAQAVMSTPLFLMKPEDSLWDAQQQMQQRRLRRLVVADAKGYLHGIVTQSSLLQVLDPMEMYGVLHILQQRIAELEADQKVLLTDRNAKLHAQIQEHAQSIQSLAQQSTLLAQAAQWVNRARDIPSCSRQISTALRKYLQIDRVIVYQFANRSSGSVIAESVDSHCSALVGRQIEDVCFQGNLGELYRRGHRRAVEDVYTANLSGCHLHLLEQMGVRAYLVVPILIPNAMTTAHMDSTDGQGADQILWGLLVAHHCTATHAWHPSELNLCEHLATYIAITVQKIYAFRNGQRWAAESMAITATPA